MVEKIQAIRGMSDVLPESMSRWQSVEKQLISILSAYGYKEIRFPLVESTQLFKRTIGEVTDIVEKEMYTFHDLNGDSLTLRPEGTAVCVRACLEHGLLHHQQQKLWYMGPMFRHERPQKGRYRQFTQLGVEAFGIPGAPIDLELIALGYRCWKALGFSKEVSLQINTLGTLAERQHYKLQLLDYFRTHYSLLDEDSKKRLGRNPLRILDSKNKDMAAVIAKAPRLIDALGEESLAHFRSLCEGLDALGIPYTKNPFLVRGLDYYGQTVFEWVTEYLGSQATICAGGRYDILVEQLGGAPTPAVGFAFGLERILLLMEQLGLFKEEDKKTGIFIIASHDKALLQGLALAESMRDAHPGLEVLVNTLGGSFKNQFKKADKSSARFAVILGDDEVRDNTVTIKDLRQEAAQVTIKQSDLHTYTSNILGCALKSTH